MAVGKNKGLNKGGKKGGKKKVADPFLRKNWYQVKCPTMFSKPRGLVGRTFVTKTTGQRIETEDLKGRICEFNLADMQHNGDTLHEGFKKIKLCIEDIQGRYCITDFYGMSLTRDKICQLMKKRHTMVEAYTDCKTTDGFVVRVFAIAFTNRQNNQVSSNCYAQTAQIRKLRRKICQVIQGQVTVGPLKDCVKKLLTSTIETEIGKATKRLFPLKDIHVLKVKIVKKPKIDIIRLYEMHEKTDVDVGVTVTDAADEAPEAKNALTE